MQIRSLNRVQRFRLVKQTEFVSGMLMLYSVGLASYVCFQLCPARRHVWPWLCSMLPFPHTLSLPLSLLLLLTRHSTSTVSTLSSQPTPLCFVFWIQLSFSLWSLMVLNLLLASSVSYIVFICVVVPQLLRQDFEWFCFGDQVFFNIQRLLKELVFNRPSRICLLIRTRFKLCFEIDNRDNLAKPYYKFVLILIFHQSWIDIFLSCIKT